MKFSIKIVLVLCLNIPLILNAQIAYHDAITLSNNMIGNDLDFGKEEVYEILDKYYQPQINNKKQDIYDAFNATPISDPNPFIEITGGQRSSLSGPASTGDAMDDKSFGLSNIGGLNVASIADGMAKFMVERAKQELNAYFFEEFQKQVESSDELKTLFPQTTAHLSVIGNQIYNYNAYVEGLRESFEFDLSNLFIQTPKLLDTPKYKAALDKFPDLRYILKTGFYIINELDKEVHPGDILNQFPAQFESDSAPKNLYSGIQVANLFSQSLRSKSNDSYWINNESLKLLDDKAVFKIYLGLIYQLTPDNIEFEYYVDGIKKNLNFKEKLTQLGKTVNEYDKNAILYQQYIQTLNRKLSKTESTLKKITVPTDNKADPKDIYAYVQSCLDLINYSVEIKDLPYINTLVQNDTKAFQTIHQFTYITNQAANIYLNVSERNYGTAVINLTQIIDTLLTKDIITEITGNSEDKKEELENVNRKILKYGSFMANLATAENSTEAESIIESAVLPAGSSRTKRETLFNVSANAYCGLFSGIEYIEGVDNGNWNSYGVTAPIGLSISTGHSIFFIPTGKTGWEENRHGWSTSLFISIVDIGALASFRFTNDSTETVPDIELKDIISPGAFLSIGIPKSPISINAGVQMGPLLRKVTKEINDYSKSYTRFSVSLVVDIPLMNLYTKPKK